MEFVTNDFSKMPRTGSKDQYFSL